MATTTTRPASRSGTAPPPGGNAGRYPPRPAETARPRAGGRTQQGSRSIQRTGGRTQQGSQRSRPPARAARPAPASSTRSAARTASRPAQRKAPNLGRTAQQLTSPSFRNYQGIILAEFVLAELLAAATPIVTSKQDASSGQYMSPYAGQDMVKLLSIGLLYFLLALASAGGGTAGRLGAWFGGLILLVVGLNEGTNIAKVLGIFSGLAASASGAASPGAAEGSAGTIGQIAASSSKGATSG